jgi:hypothetical protein
MYNHIPEMITTTTTTATTTTIPYLYYCETVLYKVISPSIWTKDGGRGEPALSNPPLVTNLR